MFLSTPRALVFPFGFVAAYTWVERHGSLHLAGRFYLLPGKRSGRARVCCTILLLCRNTLDTMTTDDTNRQTCPQE